MMNGAKHYGGGGGRHQAGGGHHAGGGGQRHPGGGGRQGGGGDNAPKCQVFFNPSESLATLVDQAAEDQVNAFTKEIASSQIRKFFGEVKDQYRQYQSLTATVTKDAEKEKLYQDKIAARFKMIRAKVSYAVGKTQGKLEANFAHFLETSIAKVKNAEDFQKFVLHFEAVVAFIYGKGKVSKS